MQRNGSLIYVCFLCFLLLTIISTRVKYDRKNKKRNEARRNEKGLTSRQQGKKDRINSILELKQQGYNQSKIAEKLGLTRQAVSKLLKELTSVCRSVNRTVKHFQEDNSKGYKFTSKYIINALDLEEHEQRKLLTIISTGEKYRRKNEKRTPRNEEGLTSRQQAKKDRINIILELKQQGYNQSKIAEKLGITRQAVSKLLKELN